MARGLATSWLRGGAMSFAVLSLTACGVSGRTVNEASGGDASVAGTSSDAGGSAGTSNGGGNAQGGTNSAGGAGAPGSSGTADEAGATGTDGGTGCAEGALQCADNTTPSECMSGIWVTQDPCPAAKPACSNGVCAAATLTGGIVTVSNGVLSTSTVHLVEHGLEYTQTVCGTVAGQKVCVSGGIRP